MWKYNIQVPDFADYFRTRITEVAVGVYLLLDFKNLYFIYEYPIYYQFYEWINL